MSSLSEKTLEELKKHGRVKHLEEGELLLNEKSAISNIPIVLKGSIKVFQTDDDYRELLLYYLREGDTCIMSFLGGLFNEESKVKAVANEDSEVLIIPVHKTGILMREHPDWIEYIFRIYHTRFEELLEVVNAVAFKKMDERMLRYLKQKSELSNNPEVSITHDELANELGTARVVVSRLLKQMEKEKLVELGRNKIRLL